MAEFDAKTKEIIKRLQQIRVKLLREQPFYAVLLMHLKFALDESTPTLYTDSKRIAFNPYFIEKLNNDELQFVLMHEILHVALGHCNIEQSDFDHETFNIACDIVVNSNILYSLGLNKKGFKLQGETVPHTSPDKSEGYENDVIEVYNALIKLNPQKMKKYELLKEMEDLSAKSDAENEGEASVGENESNSGESDNSNETNCDQNGDGKVGNGKSNKYSVQFDDHTFWESADNKDENETWTQRMVDATETANLMAENFSSCGGKGCGAVPFGAQRIVDSLLEPQTDWREVLENFIQEEINDYSFNPPDKRFDDSPFFLPDFNEKETTVKNIVFLVDTSGSMSDEAIRLAYSEINGAIEQFGGKFEGYLAFGDTQAYDLIPINGETDIIELLAKGGGGTDFTQPINFVLDKLEELPSCMIYITDGECRFPDESITRGVPFLWLITTDVTPPWGKVGRIIIEN